MGDTAPAIDENSLLPSSLIDIYAGLLTQYTGETVEVTTEELTAGPATCTKTYYVTPDTDGRLAVGVKFQYNCIYQGHAYSHDYKITIENPESTNKKKISLHWPPLLVTSHCLITERFPLEQFKPEDDTGGFKYTTSPEVAGPLGMNLIETYGISIAQALANAYKTPIGFIVFIGYRTLEYTKWVSRGYSQLGKKHGGYPGLLYKVFTPLDK